MLSNHTRLKTILKVTLLLFFIAHYSNVTLFYHTHVVNGQVFCHSHFFGLNTKSIPLSSHSHTENQFKLIQLFNQITWISDIEVPQVPAPFVQNYFLCYQSATQAILSTPLFDYGLRAPPFTLLFA